MSLALTIADREPYVRSGSKTEGGQGGASMTSWPTWPEWYCSSG